MIIIPGFLISLVTFPGVIVHEAAHMLFCRWFKLAIFDVCFFQLKNPSGYVLHEPTQRFAATFFVSMGPFLLNTLLCVLFCSAAFLPVWELGVRDPLPYFFMWLGLSIGMHAFPSNQDLQHVFRQGMQEIRGGNVLALVAVPLVAPIWLLNFLRFFWVDLLYGFAIGILVPLWAFKALV
jgi:hypothetical protein